MAAGALRGSSARSFDGESGVEYAARLSDYVMVAASDAPLTLHPAHPHHSLLKAIEQPFIQAPFTAAFPCCSPTGCCR